MTKSIISGFTTGIVSPEMSSSIELELHRNALRECKNMIVTSRGGVKNRAGTEHVAVAMGLSTLIPFQFSVEQAYVLEFGDSRLRVIKDGALVLTDLLASVWMPSGSGTNEYYYADAGLLEPLLVLEDSSQMTDGTLGSLAAGEWDWGDNDTLGYNTVYVRLSDNTDPDTKGNGYIQIPFKTTSPYAIGDTPEIKYSQSADVLFLTHPDYAPYKLTRSSDVSWTFTKIAFIDGPYIGRVTGDEDVRIEAEFISGTTYEFTASSSIFGNVTLGEPIRLGFPIPADPTAIHWSWFTVSTLTSGTVIRADLQDAERIIYQQVQNPFFESSLDNWQDISTGTAGEISYDFTNKAAVLTDLADGQPTEMEQVVITFSQVKHTVRVVVSAMTGTSPTVYVKVGTSSGLGDIFTSPAITSTGTYTYTVLPTQSTIYLNFTTTGSTNNDVIKLTEVEFYPIGDTPASGTKHTTTDWRLAAWNSNYGFPANVVFYQQRLVYARTDNFPQTIWFSRTADFENFSFTIPGLSTDSFGIELNSQELNAIQWMLALDDIVIGTKGNVWRISGGANTDAIAPTSISARIQNKVKSSAINPQVIGRNIIVLQRDESTVKDLFYSSDADGYTGRDLTILAEHLFKGLFISVVGPPPTYSSDKIVDMAYAESPDSVLWCVKNDRTLLGLTYDLANNIFAWHEHEADTSAHGFIQVCTIPGEYNAIENARDDVYFLVRRLKSTAPFFQYHIERLGRRISNAARYDYLFLDSSVKYDNPSSPTSTVDGLEHLEGRTVTALADGDVISGLTVTNASVTLPEAASVVYVGLPFESEIETVDIEIITQDGSTQGRKKGVTKANIYFKDTRNADISSNTTDDWWPIKFEDESTGEDPPPLFTGVKEQTITGKFRDEERIKIRQTDPLPIEIKRIIPDVQYND